MPSRERKAAYFIQMKELLNTHTSIFVVEADHVGSRQFGAIRKGLRGQATVLMGKNTMMRKCINEEIGDDEDSPLNALLPLIQGNVGLIFIKENMGAVRNLISEYTTPAPARAGVVANASVSVPPGPTGCDPSMTSYFQAMDIKTKIVKGQIEIASAVNLITKGDKVTAGQADLLQKLDIKPFTYGLHIRRVYDGGNTYDAEVLSISEADVVFGFSSGCAKVAALSLELDIPNAVSIPHSLANAFKMCLSVCIQDGDANHTFARAEPFVAFIKDPSAFAGASGGGDSGGDTAAAAVVEEVEEEVDADNVTMSFGDDDDGW